MIPDQLQAYWPPEGQRLLLKAALAPPDEARAAWRAWVAANKVETVTWFEARLFASLAPRLGTLVPPDEIPMKLRGLRRYTWVRTQQTLGGVAPLLSAFHKAGLRMMPLKGGARYACAGADQPARCLADLDLLVHPDHWASALRIAYAEGWRCDRIPRDAAGADVPIDDFLATAFPIHHSLCFSKGGIELDIHHLSLFMSRNAGGDAPLWERAGSGALMGVPLEVPSVTDQLFITLAHALLYGPEPSGDWMLDAAALIQSGEVDWDQLDAESARRMLEPSIAVPLAFLAAETDLPIPRDALERMIGRFRPPFLKDFESFAVCYIPETPVLVDAVREAAAARAIATERAEDHPEPQARIADRVLLDTPIQLPADGADVWLPVPEDLPADVTTRLEISFRVRRTAAGAHTILLDVDAPGMRLLRWTSGEAPWPWWRRRRVRVALDLPSALLRRRQIGQIGIRLPHAPWYPRMPVSHARVRWIMSGRPPPPAGA